MNTNDSSIDVKEKIKNIRHEVNNNLMVIFGYTELVIKKSRKQEYVDNVNQNIDKAIENLELIKDYLKRV